MTYTIKQGRHYSGSYWDMLIRAIRGSFRSNGMEVTFSFSKECLVPSPEPEDINKLFGFSVGRDHHQESARIGWRPNGDMIDLFAYTYHKGQRLRSSLMCSVIPGQTYRGMIMQWPNSYGYQVLTLSRNALGGYVENGLNLDTIATKHMLYPYHGGDYPAAVTMTINLTRTA